jgi:alpha-ketoglutarate-dependent taurine dioxygenase
VAIAREPLTGQFAAEVQGIDLAAVDDTTAEEILDALEEHLVLVFRDQHLDDETQLALARRLGEPYVHPIAREFGATEALVEHIVDDEAHRPYQDQWHTDISWVPEPPTYAVLRAVDLPTRGGDTCWLDARAALDTLSATTRARLDGRTARHAVGMGTAFADKAGPEILATLRERFPGVDHPVITLHPPSGRACLFVNEGFTQAIDGDDGSLIAELFHHLRNPNHQFRHHWRAGDVVLWDERATQHFAVADFWPARREMARITIRAAGASHPVGAA